MNTSPDLCGKLLKSFEPESARGALLRLRQRRRNGEMVSSMQGDGLTDNSEVVLHLLELAIHAVEAAQQRYVVDGLSAGFRKPSRAASTIAVLLAPGRWEAASSRSTTSSESRTLIFRFIVGPLWNSIARS